MARTVIRRIVGILQNLQLAIILSLLFLAFGTTPLGFYAYGVISGSMEPAIPTGSLVLVNANYDPMALSAGDVIAFSPDGSTMVTHRVVSADYDADTITTKGDANEDADAFALSYSQVKGTVDCSIPGLGSLYSAFEDYHLPILLAVLAFNLLLCLISWLCARPGKKDKEIEQEQPTVRSNHAFQ